MNTIEDIIDSILYSRYVNDAQKLLTRHTSALITDENGTKLFIDHLQKKLNDPSLLYQSPFYPSIPLPEVLLKNNEQVRIWIQKKLRFLITTKADLSFSDIQTFFIENFESIKWSMNQWLLASPGVTLELFTIPDSTPPSVLKLLKKYDVQVQDLVVHFHLISNRGRNRLRDMGFVIPYEEWHEIYVQTGLDVATEILKKNTQIKGIYCDGSWIYNPANFKTASDGLPYVRFSFIQAMKEFKQRVDITDEMDSFERDKQITFAIRSERRKKLFEAGEYIPRIYATYVDVSELK